MIKNNKVIFSGLILISLGLFFNSCTQPSNPSLVGKWRLVSLYDDPASNVLKKDTMKLDDSSFLEFSDTTFTLYLVKGERKVEHSTSYKIKNKEVILKEGVLQILELTDSTLKVKTTPNANSKDKIVLECIKK
jgi:hypothetical protein